MPVAANIGPPRGLLISNKPIVLWIHDPGAIYNHDAVINPEIFPNFRDGQLLKILCPRITQQQPQQQQSQNANNKLDQQDGKKHLDHNILQQQQQQQQQNQLQNQQTQQNQKQQSDQSSPQTQQSQSSDKQEHNEQLDFVIVKGHAADKENLTKQQQLQVNF